MRIKPAHKRSVRKLCMIALATHVAILAPLVPPFSSLTVENNVVEASTRVATFTVAKDSFAGGGTPNTNRHVLSVGETYWLGATITNSWGLVQFQNINLPPGAVVKRAWLDVYQRNSIWGDNNTLYVQRATAGWGVNNTQKPSVEGNYGSGYFPSFVITVDGSYPVKRTIELNRSLITKLQQSNNGIVLRNSSGDGDNGVFLCATDGQADVCNNSAYHPKLHVEYFINQPPFVPEPVAPKNQSVFGGSCDESVDPAVGNCRIGEEVTLKLDGVGDGDPAPGHHKTIFFDLHNTTNGEINTFSQDISLASGATSSPTETRVLADGRYVWSGRSIDHQGMYGDQSVHFEFSVDSTPPEIPTLSALSEFTKGASDTESVQFEITAESMVVDNLSSKEEITYVLEYSTDETFENNVYEKPGQAFPDTDNVRIEIGPKGIDELEGTADDILAGTTYYFRTKSVDSLGNTSDWSNAVASTVDATAPTVTDVLASPLRISPVNETSIGSFDTLDFSYSFSEEYTKEVGYEILDNLGEVVFIHAQAPADSLNTNTPASFSWNGLSIEGDAVADGAYIIRPIVTDLAGNSVTIKESEHQRLFTIDNAGVEVMFNQLNDVWVKNSEINLTGQVQDIGDLKAFSAGIAGEVLSDVKSITGFSYDEDTDQFDWLVPLNRGENTFNFQTVDTVENTNEYERKVYLDSTEPSLDSFVLKNTKTGEVHNLLNEKISLNDKTPGLVFELSDFESGIVLGTNPKGFSLSTEFEIWNRESGEFETLSKELIKNEVNLDPSFNSDMTCVAAEGAMVYERNGKSVSDTAICTIELKSLGDTSYTFDLEISDLVGNKVSGINTEKIRIDAYVYSEIKAPVDTGTYPTKQVGFIGFASRYSEVQVYNAQLDETIYFIVDEENSNNLDLDTTHGLHIVCGANLVSGQGFINHDNNPLTKDEEVCRWEVVMPQYFDVTTDSSLNVNTVSVKDSVGNEVTHTLNTAVEIDSFEVAINPNYVYLSPNGDGNQDDITFFHFVYNPKDPYNRPEIRSSKLEIRNSVGEIVKEFDKTGSLSAFTYWDLAISNSESLPGSYPDSYPGELSTLPDGVYTYELSVESADGIVRSSGQKTFFVNTELEDSLVISTPQDGLVTTNGVVNIEGQAPVNSEPTAEEDGLVGQIYVTICVDSLVPEDRELNWFTLEDGSTPDSYPLVNYGQGNTVECDHWQEVLVDEYGYFNSIIIFPAVEGVDSIDHTVKALARDDFGNSTPYSNEVTITVENTDIFVDVSLEPTLTGVTSTEDFEKFLNGELSIDDIRSLRIRSVVNEGTEQVELKFADYQNVTQRPDAPSFNYIATLTDKIETDPVKNPRGLDSVKYNHNKTLGDQTIPYENCEAIDSEVGCVWDYHVPLNDEYAGLYEIQFKGKAGTSIESMTRGFQVDGRIPAAPVFMVVEKWDGEDQTWVKMEEVNYENFTDTGKIRFRGAAEPGTKVELWTADEYDDEGNLVKEGVKFVDMIVGNTGVWEFIIELESFLNGGGSLDGLPGGPGDSNPGEECTGIECLRARLGFILKGYKVDPYGVPTQVDDEGNPETVESEGTVTVNYDRRAPGLVSVDRETSDALALDGWVKTGDQASFDIETDEQVFVGEIIKEDGFIRNLDQLNVEVEEDADFLQGIINIDTPEEGIYNVGIRLKDNAENRKTYTADKFERYGVEDFRIFVDNTSPGQTEINTSEWSDIWEEGGVNAGEGTVEVGRTNPGYVTRADSVRLTGRAEYGQRIQIFMADNSEIDLEKLALINEANNVLGFDPLAIGTVGGQVIDTITVSEENCIAFDFDKEASDGLVTKYGTYCDWSYDYVFPDDGANNYDGVPMHGYALQARVIDRAANTSEWSNSVIVYHDTEAPTETIFFDYPDITKELSIDLKSFAERFSDLEYSKVDPDGTIQDFDLTINGSDRLTEKTFELGTEGDDREGCVVEVDGRRIGTCEDGNYEFNLTATDAVGFSTSAPVIKVERDTVKPKVPVGSLYICDYIHICLSITSAEKGSMITYQGNDLFQSQYGSGAVRVINNFTPDTVYAASVTSRDSAGNESGELRVSIRTPKRDTGTGNVGGVTVDRINGLAYEHPIKHPYVFLPGGEFGVDRGDYIHEGLDYSTFFSRVEGDTCVNSFIGTGRNPIPVHAAADGTVIDFRTDGVGGVFMDIAHPNGTRTRYLHLASGSNKVSVGQKVERGQHVADLGLTGITTGCHLHFEIWEDTNGADNISNKLDPKSVIESQVNQIALEISREIDLYFTDVKDETLMQNVCGSYYIKFSEATFRLGFNQQTFNGGAMVHTPTTDTIVFIDRSDWIEYNRIGGACGVLGHVELTENTGVAAGTGSSTGRSGTYQNFEGGFIYTSSAASGSYAVYEPILNIHESTGGTWGGYGFPINHFDGECQRFEGGEICKYKDYATQIIRGLEKKLGNATRQGEIHQWCQLTVQDYSSLGSNGDSIIMYNPDNGTAFVITGGIWRTYWQNGGCNRFGAPLMNEAETGRVSGWYQEFENADIYWAKNDKKAQPGVVEGEVRDRYNTLDGTWSYLGFPYNWEKTATSVCQTSGVHQEFRGGKIYASDLGTIDWEYGDMMYEYWDRGEIGGSLGWPSLSASISKGNDWITFENGYLDRKGDEISNGLTRGCSGKYVRRNDPDNRASELIHEKEEAFRAFERIENGNGIGAVHEWQCGSESLWLADYSGVGSNYGRSIIIANESLNKAFLVTGAILTKYWGINGCEVLGKPTTDGYQVNHSNDIEYSYRQEFERGDIYFYKDENGNKHKYIVTGIIRNKFNQAGNVNSRHGHPVGDIQNVNENGIQTKCQYFENGRICEIDIPDYTRAQEALGELLGREVLLSEIREICGVEYVDITNPTGIAYYHEGSDSTNMITGNIYDHWKNNDGCNTYGLPWESTKEVSSDDRSGERQIFENGTGLVSELYYTEEFGVVVLKNQPREMFINKGNFSNLGFPKFAELRVTEEVCRDESWGRYLDVESGRIYDNAGEWYFADSRTDIGKYFFDNGHHTKFGLPESEEANRVQTFQMAEIRDIRFDGAESDPELEKISCPGVCGDNVKEDNEQCDGTDTIEGLTCNDQCMVVCAEGTYFDATSNKCIAEPVCGNSVKEGGEECDGEAWCSSECKTVCEESEIWDGEGCKAAPACGEGEIFDTETSSCRVKLACEDSQYKLPWTGGTSYYVTQDRQNPVSHTGYYNQWAYDFGLSEGDAVVAAEDGVVEFVTNNVNTGGCDPNNKDANKIVIKHTNERSTIYLHLNGGDKILVKKGDTVKAGQKIGEVGWSGYVCGLHLHYSEIKTSTIEYDFAGFGESTESKFRSSSTCNDTYQGVPQYYKPGTETREPFLSDNY